MTRNACIDAVRRRRAYTARVVANGGDDSSSEVSLNTAAVVQIDLVVTEELPGTLGYGSADPVTFHSSDDGVMALDGVLNGTVTFIVAEGSVVDHGDVLYEVVLVQKAS